MNGTRKAFAAWGVVAAATLVTSVVGLAHSTTPNAATTALITLALGKAWLVLMFFMEVHRGPRALKIMAHTWCGLVLLALVATHLLA